MAIADNVLIQFALDQLKDPKKLAKYIADLATVVPAATKLLDNAAPLVEKAKEFVPESPIPEDVVVALKTAPEKAVDKKNEVISWFESIKDAKQAAKLIKVTRQTVLENATAHLPIKEFVKQYVDKSVDAPIGAFDMPGCFVIATYKKLDFDKDLTDYTGVFVGKADNVRGGIAEAISKLGNPDVYADVKYDQNVHVFIYNCLPEDLENKYQALFEVVDAGSSYNG